MGNLCYTNKWKNYNYNSTNNFSLNDKYLKCRVVDIYDGDTCTCVLFLFNNYYKFTIRLADIDTCELRSKEIDNKELAYNARMFLFKSITDYELDMHISRKEMRNKLNEKIYLIYILCGGFDKYGRLLGWLFNKNNIKKPNRDDILLNSFNYQLIYAKLAYEYKGNTKLTENKQVELFNKN
jgi:endonuclease YncB( thermonuclease family)